MIFKRNKNARVLRGAMITICCDEPVSRNVRVNECVFSQSTFLTCSYLESIQTLSKIFVCKLLG